jgi:hypothetical protein
MPAGGSRLIRAVAGVELLVRRLTAAESIMLVAALGSVPDPRQA